MVMEAKVDNVIDAYRAKQCFRIHRQKYKYAAEIQLRHPLW